MKKIFLFFLLIIILLGLVRAVTEVEHSLKATVTVNPVPGKLNVSPEYLAINALPLSLVEKSLRFQQDGNADLNVSFGLGESEINEWLSFSEVEFTVKPQEEKEIKIFINISAVKPGDYSTNILATGNPDLIIPVNITVTDKYKIGVNIDVLQRKINDGESISVLTKLTKSKLRKKDKDVEGNITVDLEYRVLRRKELITTLNATMDVIDYSEENIHIHIPDDAASGRYTVEVTAVHSGKTAKDKDSFSVARDLFTGFFNFFRWFR